MTLPRILVLCLALVGCQPSVEDDAFAREFIVRLKAGDSSVTALLEPNSEISADGGRTILSMRDSFPVGAIDTLRALEWTRERDAEGEYRTITYALVAQADSLQVKVWLVGSGDRRFVNTIMLQRFQ